MSRCHRAMANRAVARELASHLRLNLSGCGTNVTATLQMTFTGVSTGLPLTSISRQSSCTQNHMLQYLARGWSTRIGTRTWRSTPLVLTSQRRPLNTEACQYLVFNGLQRG